MNVFRPARVVAFFSALLVSALLPSAQAADKPMKVGFCPDGVRKATGARPTASRSRAEAAKRGIELKFSDGQGKQENQIRAIRSFIAQRVDVIVIAPIVGNRLGSGPAGSEARPSIPVILTDRSHPRLPMKIALRLFHRLRLLRRRMAADWLARRRSAGRGNIVELQGHARFRAGERAAHRSFADAIKQLSRPEDH